MFAFYYRFDPEPSEGEPEFIGLSAASLSRYLSEQTDHDAGEIKVAMDHLGEQVKQMLTGSLNLAECPVDDDGECMVGVTKLDDSEGVLVAISRFAVVDYTIGLITAERAQGIIDRLRLHTSVDWFLAHLEDIEGLGLEGSLSIQVIGEDSELTGDYVTFYHLT